MVVVNSCDIPGKVVFVAAGATHIYVGCQIALDLIREMNQNSLSESAPLQNKVVPMMGQALGSTLCVLAGILIMLVPFRNAGEIS